MYLCLLHSFLTILLAISMDNIGFGGYFSYLVSLSLIQFSLNNCSLLLSLTGARKLCYCRRKVGSHFASYQHRERSKCYGRERFHLMKLFSLILGIIHIHVHTS